MRSNSTNQDPPIIASHSYKESRKASLLIAQPKHTKQPVDVCNYLDLGN